MKFTTTPFDDLPEWSLRRLMGLTNDVARGDVRDTGRSAASVFKRKLDERLMGERFPDTWAIIAKDRFRHAGWCLLQRHPYVDPEYGQPITVPTASIGFYVHPDYRRQGLGFRLIQEASDHARNIGAARLLANTWNRSSRSFFLRAGFLELTKYVSGCSHGIAVLELTSETAGMPRVG
jgi:GNAT superfamily N-acetyltransferase